jgi:hypothetical protein
MCGAHDALHENALVGTRVRKGLHPETRPLAGARSETRCENRVSQTFKLESLILAQSERLRRA